MPANYIVSVDMGGTKILASVLNTAEGIISKDKKPTNIEAGSKAYISDLTEIVGSVIEKAEIKNSRVAAVCIGIPGSVNPVTGKIGLAPNLGLKDFDIKSALKKHISFPVLIENDVNLAALGIKKFGVGKKARNMLVVSVGTGIGGGIIIDEKIYRGSNFVAGEIGHIPYDKSGPLCGCGRKGCFEAVASRTAIVNRIIYDVEKGKKSSLKNIIRNGKKIKSGTLKSAVQSGDEVVMNRINDACDVIGEVLAGLTNLMNFDMIVLAGGLIQALEKFMLPRIKSSFNNFVLSDSAYGLEMLASRLGDDAAIFGGIALAEEYLKINI